MGPVRHRGRVTVLETGGNQRSGMQSTIRGLTPGYFALVMASGIISVGMRLGGYVAVSVFLLLVCATSFVVLVVLHVWRVVA